MTQDIRGALQALLDSLDNHCGRDPVWAAEMEAARAALASPAPPEAGPVALDSLIAPDGIERIWTCKIGTRVRELPKGADGPMRKVVFDAFARVTGYEADYCFSGWGGELLEIERAVVEDRDPVWSKVEDATPQRNTEPAPQVERELPPLPEPVHYEHREPRERYTADQMRAYALAARAAPAAEANSERYLWLRSDAYNHCDEGLPHPIVHKQNDWGNWKGIICEGDELDKAIDEARKGGGKG